MKNNFNMISRNMWSYFSEFYLIKTSKLNDGFCFNCNSQLQLFDEIVSLIVLYK